MNESQLLPPNAALVSPLWPQDVLGPFGTPLRAPLVPLAHVDLRIDAHSLAPVWIQAFLSVTGG